MPTETTVVPVNGATTLDELDELVDSYDDDEPWPEPEPARKPTKADRAAAKALAEQAAERARLQALVPWRITGPNRYGTNDYEQLREIETWADDAGRYPRRYRSYTRGEWASAIALLAGLVDALAETHPDYQRKTGLYVEEQSDDLLVIRAKKFQLVIQIPSKATPAGKKFELKPIPGIDGWGGDTERADAVAELLSHAAGEDRELLLDLCCQYLRPVRLRVNKAAWATEHPDLAHLLEKAKR